MVGETMVAETITNSAVEGENLDERHVRSSVVRRLGIESAGLPEPHPREQALVDLMLDATRGHGTELSEKRLFSWQAALFPTGYSGLRTVKVGGWRVEDPMQVVSGPVGKERVHYEAPASDRVPFEMATFLDWWNSPPAGLDGLLRAAVAHLWFVTIHPFDDGNGRLARVLTEMALSQDEGRAMRVYSLSSQILKRRDEYYAALSAAQRSEGEVTDWLLWFLTSLESSMLAGEQALEGVLWRCRFWHRHRLTPMNERQRKALDILLSAGPGGFEGGMTTRKYASLNRVSKPTAFRELAELKEMGVLTITGAGRSVRYEVNF
jgi:Fic family protein